MIGWHARAHHPFLVGPWTSEMGFEVLYWVPYLTHLIHHHRIEPERLIILTRGGAAAWYPPGGQRIELYDYVPAQDLRLLALDAQQTRLSVKQFTMTPFERRLVALVAARIGVRHYGLLHPSRMYRQLDPWWPTQKMGLATMMKQLRIAPLPPLTPPLGLALPERFVVMRWYQRATWPLRPELVDWTHALARTLATTIPVVILVAPPYADDHIDFPVPEGAGITVVPAEPWRDNFAVQTAIVQRAAGFVGTWGGLAQLAVRCQIPTLALFDKWHGCSYQHRIMTEWLALQQGTPCVIGRPMDLEQIRTMLPAGVLPPDPPKGSSS